MIDSDTLFAYFFFVHLTTIRLSLSKHCRPHGAQSCKSTKSHLTHLSVFCIHAKSEHETALTRAAQHLLAKPRHSITNSVLFFGCKMSISSILNPGEGREKRRTYLGSTARRTHTRMARTGLAFLPIPYGAIQLGRRPKSQ